jgi:hypothetical protein
MIDGVKIYYHINDFEDWKRATNAELYTPTDLETGAAKGKLRHINGRLQQTITHRGNFETYRIVVKETTCTQVNGDRSISYFLIIDGSFHKNHFGGENYLPFTWDNLQSEISKMEKGLRLFGPEAVLSNLEIGLNVAFPLPVFPFLQRNLISYKGNQFNKYTPDKKGNCLGYVCPLSQYSVKVYDKGKQFNLPYHLMRFELRYLKMQTLKKRGIKTFADLTDANKVKGLLDFLLAAWDNILLFDDSIDLNNPNLKPQERELLKDGRRPRFWEELKETNIRRFNYQRWNFRKLVNKYGQGVHEKIKAQILTEWEILFKNCTILPHDQPLVMN